MTKNLQEVGVTKITEEFVEESILKQRQQRLVRNILKGKVASLLSPFN